MPPSIPQFKVASINSSSSNKSTQPMIKPIKKNNLLIFGIILLIILMIGGIVAVSLTLQQKPISEKAKASVWQDYAGQTKCGLTFVGAAENPSCEDLTPKTNITPRDPSKKNIVSQYTVTYTVTNNDDKNHTLEYMKNSNYCTDAYGEMGERNFGCWKNGKSERITVLIEKGKTELITVSVSSLSGQPCGSYQTDFAFISVDGNSECKFVTPFNETLTSTSTCQTGNECVAPTATTAPPSATPIPPSATPIPPTLTPNPRATATPIPPTLTPNPRATATPVPPTAPPNSTSTPVPPTSPPSSTATPQPTSSTCVQKIPNIPQGVGIEIINNNQCKFSWNEVSNITGYQVSWGENPNGEGKPNANLGKVLTYTFDCPDLATKTYYFKVRAINECAEGTFSNIIRAGNVPSPTEILLANTTSTIGPSKKPITPSIPSAGIAQFGFLLVPLGIILMALIL